MSFARVNGGVVHYLDEGPREGRRSSSSTRSAPTSGSGTTSRASSRATSASSVTTSAATACRSSAPTGATWPTMRAICRTCSTGSRSSARRSSGFRSEASSPRNSIASGRNCSPPWCSPTRPPRSAATSPGTRASPRSSAAASRRSPDSVLERWFTADFRARRRDELIGWRAMLTRTPRQGYLAACGALKRADLRPYAGAIGVATLCLVGEEDGSTPVALVREFGRPHHRRPIRDHPARGPRPQYRKARGARRARRSAGRAAAA